MYETPLLGQNLESWFTLHVLNGIADHVIKRLRCI